MASTIQGQREDELPGYTSDEMTFLNDVLKGTKIRPDNMIELPLPFTEKNPKFTFNRTTALQRTDMKAVALQLALELLHQKEDRDLVTGLKSRTHAGRPNWNKVFTKLREENKGQVTVFYCGNPILAGVIKGKCAEFGFKFRKEVF